MLTLERLTTLLAQFPRLTVGLVGDLFLDRYLEIPAGTPEYSIETGLEAYQVTRVRNSPGALGTVMNNLAALGVGTIRPVAVIGDDGHGYDLLQSLASLPVDTRHILRCPERLTPTYTKPLRQGADGVWQELHRLDVRTRAPLNEGTLHQVCRQVDEVVRSSDGLIVLDQVSEENHGVVHDAVRTHLAELGRDQPEKLIYVDSRAFLGRFDFGTLKGNRSEILAAAGEETNAGHAVAKLAARTGRPVFCTVGEDGCLVGRPGGQTTLVPGYRVNGPVDIVGAGDSATSGIVLSLLAGGTEIEAAAVANLVASITVQQIGTTGTATPQQVLDRWQEMHAT
jgi:bifunctional ADP-heptose synthase (sugar kinase/adenylyltransferase)